MGWVAGRSAEAAFKKGETEARKDQHAHLPCSPQRLDGCLLLVSIGGGMEGRQQKELPGREV